MSRKSASQISASALATAHESVAQPVKVGFQAVTGDAASTDALARLDHDAHELRNQEHAKTLARAIQAIHVHDFQRAQKLALKTLERDDQVGVAWHVLAVAREKLGDFAGSMRCYDAALKLLPNQAAS